MLKSIEKIPFCEIFRPTLKEFENFSEYLEKTTKKAKSGIFKVIPPRGWNPRKDKYINVEYTIPHPIEQIVTGKEGIYELFLMTRESRTLTKYKKLVETFDKIAEQKPPEETEKLFWRTIKFSSPLYGADAPGSLFDPGVNWNLCEIDNLLKKGLERDIMGVTTPYLYFGSWKAMFAWHKEDLDLYSINYLHFGKPKCWYGLRQEEEKRFQEFASNYFPEASKECSEFLRHKTFLLHPGIVMENGFNVAKCLQYPGEFVVTKCASYHAGFNMGFNCAEAVNFALKNWIDYGKRANYCKCQKDSVKIDMKIFCENLGLSGLVKYIKPKIKKSLNSNKKLQDKSNHEVLNILEANLESNKKLLRNKTKRSMVSKKESSSSSMDDNPLENWLCCDKCNKWRKITNDSDYIRLKKGFICNFFKGINCKTAEENWKKKYTTLNRKIIKSNVSRKKLLKYYASMKNTL